MKKLYFSKNVVVVVVVDALLFFCALYLAYLLRFDFSIPRFYRVSFQQILPQVILWLLIRICADILEVGAFQGHGS